MSAVGGGRARALSVAVYVAITAVGLAAFLYPFWLPQEAAPTQAHQATAPFLAGILVGLLVLAVGLELRGRGMTSASVAILGLLAAATGLLRLIDLPGGGSGMFPLLILAGAAFGARFGMVLGMSSMALSALLTGGLGPWLPFQMLAAGWMGGTSGWAGRFTPRLGRRGEVAALALLGWAWGLVYGAILNLWSWPFSIGEGELAWVPGSGALATLHQYHRFYVVTSMAWDAAGAIANAAVIVAIGAPVLASMRRFSHRLEPVVELEDLDDGVRGDGGNPTPGGGDDARLAPLDSYAAPVLS